MLTTPRINILPLSYRELVVYLQANDVFEKERELLQTGRMVNAGVRSRIEKFTLPSMQTAFNADYLYHTFWVVVDKATSCIVAELGFKGPPGVPGEIEIGYGTMPAHQGKGYMTEAVGTLLGWAAEQPGVHTVLAETDKSNSASIRVVQKNGFEQFARKEPMLWWRKVLHPADEGKPPAQ